MGNTDSIPVVSQVKSLTQYIGGDSAGALATQQNFAYNNTFPGISQIASAGYAIGGHSDQALDLQKKFADDMERVIESIPVAGHIDGGIHYALGDKEKGDAAMKAASRSTGVVIGGVGGFAVGGPAGAVAGGIAGGAAADGIITGSEILAHGPTAQSYGVVAAGQEIAKAIEGKRNITIGEVFDMAMVPVADGLGGYGAGKIAGKPLAFGETVEGKQVPIVSNKGVIPVVEQESLTGAKIGTKIVEEDLGNSVIMNTLDQKKALDNRANQLNPNHEPSGPGHEAGYKGAGTKADLDNHANQLNPNNMEFKPKGNRPILKSAGVLDNNLVDVDMNNELLYHNYLILD